MHEEQQWVIKIIDFEQVMKKTSMKAILKTKDYKSSKPK